MLKVPYFHTMAHLKVLLICCFFCFFQKIPSTNTRIHFGCVFIRVANNLKGDSENANTLCSSVGLFFFFPVASKVGS